MVPSLMWTPPQAVLIEEGQHSRSGWFQSFHRSTGHMSTVCRLGWQRTHRCTSQRWDDHRQSWTFYCHKAEGCRWPCSNQRPSQPRYILPRGQGLWRSNTTPNTPHRKWFLFDSKFSSIFRVTLEENHTSQKTNDSRKSTWSSEAGGWCWSKSSYQCSLSDWSCKLLETPQ